MPVIYKIPLNKFVGEVLKWTKGDYENYLYAEDVIELVSIEEIKSHITIVDIPG